jgi:hypothetical protein
MGSFVSAIELESALMSERNIPIIPLRVVDLHRDPLSSSCLVDLLDHIRFELIKNHPEGEMEEVAWFIREYPRAYRYHLECADFRLRSISRLYQDLHRELAARVGNDLDLLEVSQADQRVRRIYWDFESLLTEIGIALDLLARIVGTAYRDEMPPSFNRMCRKEIPGDSILALFQAAQSEWVNRMKDYRDCFVHYTPVDTMLSIRMVLRKAGWETRCKIPSNPNERESLRFRFPLRVELLRYALSVRRKMKTLDKNIAAHIGSIYRSGLYPARVRGLFSVGRRERKLRAAEVRLCRG